MQMSRRHVLPIAIAALVSAVAGCGGDSATTATTDSSSPAMIPRAQFVKRAKAICEAEKKNLSEEMNAFYERRARETGEQIGLVGAVEAVPEVVVPSLRGELDELEAIGLPKGEAYEAEAVWQTLRTVLHEVEAEGIYAWRSAKLLPPFRNRAKPFGLQYCIVN
jgi:hypothetical protein